MAQSALASETLSRAYERSRDVFAGLADETRGFYDDARRWLPEHATMVAVLSSTAVGCGLLGYLAGRRRQPAPPVSPRRAEMASSLPMNIPELDIAPFFKFLKLWMLYRVATKD